MGIPTFFIIPIEQKKIIGKEALLFTKIFYNCYVTRVIKKSGKYKTAIQKMFLKKYQLNYTARQKLLN